MSGQMWWLRNESEMGYFQEHVARMRLAGQRPRVQFVDEKRSQSQNDMSWALYRQIAAQVDDQSVREIRAEVKLEVGVPILRANDEDFRDFYDAGLKHLTYEQKLHCMEKDYCPVTSLMGKKMFSDFIDDVIRRYSQRGLSLVSPAEAQSYGDKG